MAAKKKQKKTAASKKKTARTPSKKTAARTPSKKKKARTTSKKKPAKKRAKARAQKPVQKTVQKTAPKAAPPSSRKTAARSKTGNGAPALVVDPAIRLPSLSHHAVSLRQMDSVAHEGLRGDGEILHVEENEFAPCRLVDHGEGRFSLCFDDFRMPDVPLFAARGLQGGGYTWEAVVTSLIGMRRPELAQDLTYDSEAGMFVALGGRESLRVVAKLIQESIADARLLQEALERADPDSLE